MESVHLKFDMISVAANGERIPTRSPLLPGRKSLSDITNLQHSQQQQSSVQDENPKPVSCTPKDYIEKLHKKLRLNLQKLGQQNWQLAQANSNMLAEKQKPLQKIGIKDEPGGCEEMTETAKGEINSNRRRLSRRTSSSNQSLTQQVAVKEKVENKRICLRRRSSTSTSEQLPPTEDLFEIEDAKFPVRPLSDSVQEDCPTRLSDSSFPNSDGKSISEKEMRDHVPQNQQPQEPRRSSIGRPLRRAAVKVNSYKEVPLNVKMRR
ncbi:hypothetical protein ACLOJK_000545 [Asimina triloba]